MTRPRCPSHARETYVVQLSTDMNPEKWQVACFYEEAVDSPEDIEWFTVVAWGVIRTEMIGSKVSEYGHGYYRCGICGRYEQYYQESVPFIANEGLEACPTDYPGYVEILPPPSDPRHNEVRTFIMKNCKMRWDKAQPKPKAVEVAAN